MKDIFPVLPVRRGGIMKPILTMLLILFFVLPSYGAENNIPMLVIDNDPRGTNVRETPGGKVVRVIPYGGKTDDAIKMRRVTVLGRDGEWLRVRLADNAEGWMHRSVLGSCASATEDGDPPLYAKPDDNTPEIATVKNGTPLNLLDVRGGWVKVEYTGPGRKKIAGWLMEQALFSNPYNDCRAR